MKTRTPSEVAAELAKALDRDPVAAAMVRDHLPVRRVLELLDLPADEVLWYYGIKTPVN